MKMIGVVGARPNFMKMAALLNAVDTHNRQKKEPKISSLLVHTGQHYDEKMSDIFFRMLQIPSPDINLEVGSGSHAVQTAEIMKKFEPVLLEHRPDLVIVVGDVNSTIACALVAAKLGIKIAHVEAGLRSFDRTMPEEINRVLTDAISDLLLTSERGAEENLLKEGIAKEKIYFVGNTMIDTLLKHKRNADESKILSQLGCVEKEYAVLTLHRPSNVDDPALLKEIFGALNEITKKIKVVFPIHPRTKKEIEKNGIALSEKIVLCEPLGYLDFLKLVSSARFVLTDSGGIQEETTVLGVPCLTIRENTERPSTLTDGTNTLVGTDREKIVKESFAILNGATRAHRLPELWDGKAGERVIDVLTQYFSK